MESIPWLESEIEHGFWRAVSHVAGRIGTCLRLRALSGMIIAHRGGKLNGGRAAVQSRSDHTLRLERDDAGWHATGDLAVRLGSPHSIYAEWRWDGHRLSLRNDRYGMLPVFAVVEPNRVILSTSIQGALEAGAPTDLDPAAMAVILRLGYPVGDDTPFLSIRTIPPGVTIDWDAVPALRGGPFIVPPNGLARDPAMDAYVDLFRQAMGRCSPSGRFVVPLSGGRDSRHILLALLEAGHRPDHLVTTHYRSPRSREDVRIAALVAEELGLGHEVLSQTDLPVVAELRKNLLTNYCTPESHAWYLPVADHLATGFDVSYDGIAGDVLSMARYLRPADLEEFRKERFENLARSMLERDGTSLRGMLRTAAVDLFSLESAIERLRRELPRHAGASNPVRSFRFWNYTRRAIGPVPFSMVRGPQVHAPYLDHDVFDMLAGLAPEVLMERAGHFHTDVIKHGYPRYAHLPFESADYRGAGYPRSDRQYARNALMYLIRTGPATQISRRYVMPRLARCVLDPSYGQSVTWLAPRAIYLTQLQAMIERVTSSRTT